jgi:hypothetical protein
VQLVLHAQNVTQVLCSQLLEEVTVHGRLLERALVLVSTHTTGEYRRVE